MIHEKAPPCNLIYIKNEYKQGPSVSRNTALKEATGDIVIFLDSDALAPSWYISEEVETHRANPGIILDGPIINISSPRDIVNPRFKALTVRFLAFMDFRGVHFITANASCRRADLIKVGGFDEEFAWAWEDVDLGIRLIESGLRCMKNRKAYVLHCKTGEPGLMDQVRFREERAQYAGLFYRKHPSARAAWMSRLRYLTYERILQRLGWTERYLDSRKLTLLDNNIPFWPPFFKKLCQIHAHAIGLKKSL